MGGRTLRVVLLDIGAQPLILRVQFTRRWACLTPNYKNLGGKIHTTSGSVKEVLKESSDLIAFNFNEGTDQELCLQVKCFVTNATNYDVIIGQKALFPPGFTINNWFEHAYYQVD